MGLIDEATGKLSEYETSHLYKLDGKSNELTTIVSGISLFNGPTWTTDHKSFIHVDSALKQVYKYDYDIESAQLCTVLYQAIK